MTLADVVEQCRFHPDVVEPAVTGHLGGLVPMTLVGARLREEQPCLTRTEPGPELLGFLGTQWPR
jgi:hypothetical protein